MSRLGNRPADAGWSHEEYLAVVAALIDLAVDGPSQLHHPASFAICPINEVLRNRL